LVFVWYSGPPHPAQRINRIVAWRAPGGSGPGHEYCMIKPPSPLENLDHEDRTWIHRGAAGPAESHPQGSNDRRPPNVRGRSLILGSGRQDPGRLAASLEQFVGHPACSPAQLRGDLERFVFLLGGSDGKPLFGP
jgi:hypothetical protein